MVGAVAVAIAGAAYGVEEFVLVAISFAVVLVLGAVALASRAMAARGSLEIALRLPVVDLVVGQRATAELIVTNVGLHATPPVEVEDPALHWSRSLPGLGAGRARNSEPVAGAVRSLRLLLREPKRIGNPVRLPGLRSGEEVRVDVPVPTSSRGLLGLSPLGVWCEDPLRALAWRVATGPPTHVIVGPLPQRPAVAALRPPAGPGERARRAGGEREPAAPVQQASGQQASSGYEFRALRPYVEGDRITRLHWPAFARSGELAVRDFVEPASGRVTLLVDLRPSSYGSGEDRLEQVVSCAAGAGLEALEAGNAVELCTSSGERLEITPGADACRILLCALAVLGPARVSAPSSLRPGLLHGAGTKDAPVWATSALGATETVLVSTSDGARSALAGPAAEGARRLVVG